MGQFTLFKNRFAISVYQVYTDPNQVILYNLFNNFKYSLSNRRNINPKYNNNYLFTRFKVILHQFWVKQNFPWKFNLEYGGTFTKLFMHFSSRNMFPTTRNLQIRVHVYRPHHCCGDWLTFGCFVPMIADHDLVKKR